MSNNNNESLYSGKEGWRKLLWEQTVPPGYEPRPPSPPPHPATLVPGQMWGASKEEVDEWKQKTWPEHSVSPDTTTTLTCRGEGESKSENSRNKPSQRMVAASTNVPKSSRFGRFLGAPIVPTSISESPKSALNALYGKEMTQTPITDACYYCWDDNGPAHLRRYTCVVVCPATYEIFPAGRYKSTATTASNASIGMWVDDHTGIVWYSRKKEATQGAAAFRYDCWYYREWLKSNPNAPKSKLFGKDDPYASPDDDRPQKVIAEIPTRILQSIEVQISKWKELAEERSREEEREAMVEIEDEAYRTAYLEHRSGYTTTTATTNASFAVAAESMEEEDVDPDYQDDFPLQQ